MQRTETSFRNQNSTFRIRTNHLLIPAKATSPSHRHPLLTSSRTCFGICMAQLYQGNFSFHQMLKKVQHHFSTLRDKLPRLLGAECKLGIVRRLFKKSLFQSEGSKRNGCPETDALPLFIGIKYQITR